MSNNLFGTDGIRTTVGEYPLSVSVLPQLAGAIARWAQQKYKTQNPVGLIVSDTRISSPFIKSSLISGMLLHPLELIDAGNLPTPGLFALLQDQDIFHFGIVVTASHNPYQDNGIKIFDAREGKLTDEDEQIISSLFDACTPLSRYDQVGILRYWSDTYEQYAACVLQHFQSDFLKGVTIALDCANGATYEVAPAIFNALGAHTITIHDKPDGTNINKQCGALYPEDLICAVKKHTALAGFAFDGDGDRVTMVNAQGEVKNGDDYLALLATHPRYALEKTIVSTIMSNEGLAAHLHTQQKKLVRTPVGDKHVTAYLKQYNLLLGGEQSGHIIMRDYLDAGDGIFTALRLLETILHTGNTHCATFTKYPQILINIPALIKKDLTQEPYASVLTDYAQQLSNGRLEVRYSGTENVLRVMVESKDHAQATSLAHQLARILKELLEKD